MKQDEEPTQSPCRDDAACRVIVEIGPGVERAGQSNDGDDQQDERRERIDVGQSPERRHWSLSQHPLDNGHLGEDHGAHRREIQSVQQTSMRGRQAEDSCQERSAEKNSHRRRDRMHQGTSMWIMKIFMMAASNVPNPVGTWSPITPSTARLMPTATPENARHCPPSTRFGAPAGPSAIRNI